MNCTYEKYLYIYNIKIMEENTLLIKKKIKHVFFVFLEQKLFFRIQFPNTFFFFWKYKKLFSKIVCKTVFKTATK